MSWTTRVLVAAIAALLGSSGLDSASAQVRVENQPGGVRVQAPGVNVRAGNRNNFRLYGQRPWFGNANVRRQLKIDDTQYNTLNSAYTQYWTPYNKVVVDVPANPNDQYHQNVATAYGTFNMGVNGAAAKVFTDADLRNRYNQLNLQYQGYGAFRDPAVQARLKLTDAQRQNFDRYYRDWNDEMNTYANEYGTDREGVNKRFTASWKTNRDRINETLTPEQRKGWSEMTGESYDFPADVYFDNDRDDRREERREDRQDRREDRRENAPRNPAPANPAPANPR
ncbi:hypothetical protein [Anatilimnocola floriformis]|uniref:hypothetical protein n=1 Tax=Anatilimnocola floriformis TaxID=2948575 RepID=UPI0020C3C6E7|nr:hypothetical protein [Anatilimnocola floriformis]